MDGAALAFRVVFAHNDLLSGNILAEVGGGAAPTRVRVIDYEYGGYSYAGFDLANHFCEHAGFDFDLARWYPGRPTQRHFFNAYLAAAGVPVPTAAGYGADASSGDSIVSAFFDSLYTHVNRFTLASHMVWGLWAVVQATHSTVDFDYLGYSRQRWGGYDRHVREFFPERAGYVGLSDA